MDTEIKFTLVQPVVLQFKPCEVFTTLMVLMGRTVCETNLLFEVNTGQGSLEGASKFLLKSLP